MKPVKLFKIKTYTLPNLTQMLQSRIYRINTNTKTCLSILDKLVNLTPDNLPQLLKELKFSLSESSSSSKSSATLTSPARETVTLATPPLVNETPTSAVRLANRSPNRAIMHNPHSSSEESVGDNQHKKSL